MGHCKSAHSPHHNMISRDGSELLCVLQTQTSTDAAASTVSPHPQAFPSQYDLQDATDRLLVGYRRQDPSRSVLRPAQPGNYISPPSPRLDFQGHPLTDPCRHIIRSLRKASSSPPRTARSLTSRWSRHVSASSPRRPPSWPRPSQLLSATRPCAARASPRRALPSQSSWTTVSYTPFCSTFTPFHSTLPSLLTHTSNPQSSPALGLDSYGWF